MTNQVYAHLKEHGPSTNPELPYQGGLTQRLREDGVRKFRLTSGKGDYSGRVGQSQHTVYYIEGKHDKTAVLEKWRAANDSSDVNKTAWSKHQSICRNYPELKEASREVFGPFESHAGNNGNSGVTDKPCPFCGQEDINSFPDHRGECPEL